MITTTTDNETIRNHGVYKNRSTERGIQAPMPQEWKEGFTHYVHEEHTEVIDEHGVIIGEDTTTTQEGRASKEPDYMKLYLNTMLSFQGINSISVDVLIAMCNCLSGQYINNGKTNLCFRSDKLSKRQMMSELGISEAAVNKHIKKMVDCGILIKSDMRSVYFVNPWILAKGKWEHIRSLRASFDFVGGQWHVKGTYEVPEDTANE